MAIIGINHLVAAPVTSYTAGAEPVYGAGKQLGHMMKVDLSWKRTDAKLYGDNHLVERDNSITEGTLTVGTTALNLDAKEMVMGLDKYNTPSTGEAQEYADDAEATPRVGTGYVYTDTDDGTLSYIACWYFLCQYQQDLESAETKGDGTNYKAPEITGTIIGCNPDSSLKTRFRKYAAFDDEADAIEWLDDLANITTGGSGGSGGSGEGGGSGVS